jgi:hypothetical protein
MNKVSEEESPNNPQYGFKYLLENQEPHGFSPGSTCNHFSPLKQLWVNKI